MILHHLTGLPSGIMIIVMNIPLFLIAWKMFGFRFMLFAAFGLVLSSTAIDLFAYYLGSIRPTEDLLLSSVYGGAVMGLGIGLIISAGSTTGGSDLAARMFRRRRPDISIGRMIMVMDAAVIIFGAIILQRYESAMYAMFVTIISNRIVDAVLYGVNYAKVLYIISDKDTQIREKITSMQRGVTVLKGVGGYTGNEKTVLLCAVKQNQKITEIKRVVYSLDPHAFIIIHEAREVLGLGFARAE